MEKIKKTRLILGWFFMLIAIMGALGMVTSLIDIDLFDGASKQFERIFPRFNNLASNYNDESSSRMSGAAPSNAPFYYAACLFSSCWLLYGKK